MADAVAAVTPATATGVVHLTASGTYDVKAGDSVTQYASLRDALDAALPTVATHEKAATLRNPDTGDLNGAWRWLPATDVEPAAVGGVRIDAPAILEMAASLNARPGPVPIDGGPTPVGMLPSDVHGTAYTGGGTPANGWAHWAVVVQGPNEDQAKLYLYAELVPEVARELDAGRIATGSVHFGYASLDGEAPRGVELISHALTNDPAVKTLAPANSVRTGVALTVRRGPQTNGAVMRARERSMSKQNAVRGPAQDAQAKLFAMLGVDPADDDAEWKARSVICAIVDAADAEAAIAAILSGGAAPAPAPAATQAAASAQFRAALKSLDAAVEAKDAKAILAGLRNVPPAAPAPAPAPADPAAQRAPVAGLADEPAKDTFITQLMAALVQAGLAKDGDTADVALAALQANAAKISGAVSAAPVDPAAQSQMSAQASAERARETAELTGLRSRVAELEKAAQAAAATEALRADEAWFDEEIAKRSKLSPLVVSAEDRKRVFSSRAAMGAKWREDVASVYLSARHQPPTGTVMPQSADELGQGGAAMTVASATDACMDEARKSAGKDEPKHITRGRAQDLARKRYPAAFADAALDD